jgi:hypothetical protein
MIATNPLQKPLKRLKKICRVYPLVINLSSPLCGNAVVSRVCGLDGLLPLNV